MSPDLVSRADVCPTESSSQAGQRLRKRVGPLITAWLSGDNDGVGGCRQRGIVSFNRLRCWPSLNSSLRLQLDGFRAES